MKNLLLFFLLTTACLPHAQRSLFVGQNNYVTPPTSNTINVIVAPTNGGNLVLNLDARNSNSLAQTGNPTTWYDLSGNQNNAILYGSLAFGTGNGGALNFPGGNANYAQARNGVYFSESSFTIQSWVYPIEVLNWNRIIDFGNGAGQNNILLSNSYATTGAPGLYIEGSQFQANTVLTLNACILFAQHIIQLQGLPLFM